MNTNVFIVPISSCHCSTYLSAQTDLCSAPRATRSSSVVTLSRPPTSSSLRIINRSFRHASPHLWNQLPVSFRQPCTKHPADDVTLSNSYSTCSTLSPSITHSLFHSRLKTDVFFINLFHHILLASTWTALSAYTGSDLSYSMVFIFVIFLSFYFGLFANLSWLNCRLWSTRKGGSSHNITDNSSVISQQQICSYLCAAKKRVFDMLTTFKAGDCESECCRNRMGFI